MKIFNKILIILLLVLLFTSIIMTIFINKPSMNKQNVIIFSNGKIIENNDNGEPIDINIDQIFTIKLPNGDYNTIEIKNKKIRCIDANCMDKICVKHDILRDDIDNDIIICAPHNLTISYVIN